MTGRAMCGSCKWPRASVRKQALQRPAHWALLRAAGGGERAGAKLLRHAQGAVRGQTRRTPGGTRHHWVLSPGDTRGLVPTTVTVYRHLSPCRHRLPGRAVEPSPSSPVASPGAWHGVPPRFGAADAVQPAVLPRVACGGLLPVTTSPCWLPSGLPAATRVGQPLARRGGGGRLPVARGGTDAVGGTGRVPCLSSLTALVGTPPCTRMGPAVGTLFVVSACAGKRRSESRAAKEPPVRQPRICSVTQRHADTSDAQSLQHPWTPLPTRRASRVGSFVLGLALGTGVAILFSLLRTWFSV
jgi:hypothetical protein